MDLNVPAFKIHWILKGAIREWTKEELTEKIHIFRKYNHNRKAPPLLKT